MDILCFASADFEEPNWVNPQHLMWRLSRAHRVLYVNSLGLRMPRAGQRDLRKIRRRVAGLWRGLARPSADRRLYVLSPPALPPGRSRLWRETGAILSAASLRRALRRLGFKRPLTWAFLPTAEPLIGRLELGPVIYHCVDAYEANPGVDAELIRTLEDRILSRATVVIASSEPLYRRLAARHPSTLLMANVADIESYPPPSAPPPAPADLAHLTRPRVGYVGNLAAYKCDMGLLEGVAAMRPDIAWIFIGGVGRGESGTPLQRLAAMPNVHLLGEKPREILAAYIHHLDVCLIPFVANETTRHSFPMKFFEYLACGRPVVTAALESLAAYLEPPLVFSYRTRGELCVAIDRALKATDAETAGRRRRLAEEHSWNRRVAEIESLLLTI